MLKKKLIIEEETMLQMRIASLSDLDRIYNIQKESFRDLYQKYNDIDSPYLETKERLLEKMKHPSSIFYLICLNNDIIGFSRVLFNGK